MIIPFNDLIDNYPNCLRYKYLLMKDGKDYMPNSLFESFFGKKGTDMLDTFKRYKVRQNRINYKPCYEYNTIIKAIKTQIDIQQYFIECENRSYNKKLKELQEEHKKQVNFHKEIIVNYHHALHELDLIRKRPRIKFCLN